MASRAKKFSFSAEHRLQFAPANGTADVARNTRLRSAQIYDRLPTNQVDLNTDGL